MKKVRKTQSYLPLTVTGYALFAALVVSVLLSTTIPFGVMLFDPRVLHVNVAIITVALTVGALLPVIVGYVAGDQAVKSKSKLQHHFNGMLFALLGYWVMTVATVLVASLPYEFSREAYNLRVILVNLLPALAVAVVTVWLALAHTRSAQAKHDLIEYRPFIVLLAGFALVMPVVSLVSSLMSGYLDVFSFAPVAILLGVGLFSYTTLRKARLKRSVRLAWSAVSVSMAFVAVYVSYQLTIGLSYLLESTPSAETQMLVNIIGWLLGAIAWAVYWFVQVRSLRVSR